MTSSKLNGGRPSADWVLEQKRNGRTYRAIGIELGCSGQNVQRILMSAVGTRSELIAKYGASCSNCGSEKKISFHHEGYVSHDVIPLCNQCHITLHSAERWKWVGSRKVMQVGHLIYLGYTHQRAAEKSGISIKTVEKHIANLYDQFRVNSVAMFVRMWHRHGMAELGQLLNLG